ncbi:MAG: sigma-54-dependent Fis family transcriptional regulator [Deltaproteobacteria bacterium]|nr:sigma-54-dependent Fis family transcriptional regulator [Deltaproteobacteria bacterium]
MRILIVDDETSIVESLCGIMQDEGYKTLSAASGEQALEVVAHEHVDLVLMDVWMPGIDGLDTLARIKESHPHLPVIMISGHGNIDTAVQATKAGAYDFIEKPPSYDKIVLSIKNALHLSQVEKDNLIFRQKAEKKPELTGHSGVINAIRDSISRVAPTDAWVLITGEHGTGKELVAQAIHRQSARCARPMIEVNCAAIPEELIESELFGHEKGAFTGANTSKRGKFDLADGSTLFLDEIADMSLKTQAKILRILQEQNFERVGGARTIPVDVRVLAATNKDLAAEILAGNFREDLYWRLNVVPIIVPPLRNRLADLPDLVACFMREFAGRGGGGKRFSEAALAALSRHNWPGNVRELRNFVERAMIMVPEDEVSETIICQLLGQPVVTPDEPGRDSGKEAAVKSAAAGFTAAGLSFKEAKRLFERDFLEAKVNENNGNIAKTATQLGMERSHLYRRLKTLGEG